jgi:hypothetical protein
LFVLVALVHAVYVAILFILHHKREYAGFLYACLFALLACTPWLYVILTHWEDATGQMAWVQQQIPWTRYLQGWAVIFSSPFLDLDIASGNLISYLLRVPVLILIAYSFVFLIGRRPLQEKLFLLLLCIIPASVFIIPDMLFGGIRSVSGRYFAPVNIAILLVVARFLLNRLDQFPSRTSVGVKLLIGALVAANIASNLNSWKADNWWNKELGRVRPEFVSEINKDNTLLIVSTGYYGSTIGDMLLLSFEVDADVHFKLLGTPEHVEYSGDYDHVYWFASSQQEVQEISKRDGFQVTEVLPFTLWQIDKMDQ